MRDSAPDNFHRHRCDCGFVWQHSDDCAGNLEAHHCPACGALVLMRCAYDVALSEPPTAKRLKARSKP